jgi:hypothetical protein
VSTVAERVAAGAAWLDEREPGWEGRIDLDALSLGDSCKCVLGQLHVADTTWWDSICEAFGVLPYAQVPANADSALGFNATPAEIRDEMSEAEYAALEAEAAAQWAELTAEWRRVITERRASCRS